MIKKELEALAEQLATAELVCRGMFLTARNARKAFEEYHPSSIFEGKQERRRLEAAYLDAQARYDQAAAQVKSLTEQADRLKAQSPELSEKRYWWDVPFSCEDPDEADTYCFDNGIYLEADQLRSRLDGAFSVLYQNAEKISYPKLSERLTDSRYLPLFLDKKKLRLHINSDMEIRYLYNVMSVSGRYEVVSYMNPNENPAAAIWRSNQAQTQARRGEYDEYLEEHKEVWDCRERFRHLSFYTNEERWLMGQMSNEDYLRESLWREYATWDQHDRMKADLSDLRWQAERQRREAQKHFVKSRKDTVYETNLLRVMPVGEIIYCDDALVTILLYTHPQTVTEYDCAGDVEMTELTGRYFEKRELFRKRPTLAPLMRHIATVYADLLPEHRVLKPCPSRCPDALWRVWSEIRWARKVTARG